MPHATLKLVPGVDENRTLALNESGISVTNLVRFVPDRQGVGLVQKLGGWTNYYTGANGGYIGSIVRALWAWEDTNSNTYLALGCQSGIYTITNISGNGTTISITVSPTPTLVSNQPIVISNVTPSTYNGQYTITSINGNVITVSGTVTDTYVSGGSIYTADSLSVISNNIRTILTPRYLEENLLLVSSAPSANQILFTTTANSSIVNVNIPSSNITSYDLIFINTQISIDGLILSGLYNCTFFDSNNFTINAGSPAISGTSVAYLPSFSFTSGSNQVSVNFPNHGLQVGDIFTILTPLSNSGVTIYGNYNVQAVADVNNFTIFASTSATATATSVPLNNGNVDATFYVAPGVSPESLGYGAADYGYGNYGTSSISSQASGIAIQASDWTLDNWGQILMSCPVGGAIFYWDTTSGTSQAQIVSESPIVNDGIFVAMPQRQVVAWGSTSTGIQDPLLINWSDVQNYASWTPTITNQAGSYRLPRGSKIVSGIQGPQQGIIWTDLGVWSMQYVGPPYVYQFNEIGNGCGLIARKAAASMNGVVYWMSQSQFYMLGTNGIQIIACPIWDVIFQDLDKTNLNKIRIATNSQFGEVSWYYPTTSGGGEITNYVKYNVVLNQWDFGTLSRTAWINQSVLGPPIGAGSDEYIYQHETSQNAAGLPMQSSFQTGYFAISDGEWKTFVDQVWPDMKWGYYGGSQNATVNLTFYVTDYPGDTPKVFGPYPLTQATEYITPRFRGRLVSFKISSDDYNSFWRIGAMRYRYQQDGKF